MPPAPEPVKVPVPVVRPPVVRPPVVLELSPGRAVASPAEEHAQNEVVTMSETMTEDTLTTSPRASLHRQREPLVGRAAGPHETVARRILEARATCGCSGVGILADALVPLF